MQHNGGTFFKSSYIWGGTALDIGKCLSQGKTRASHLIAALELLRWGFWTGSLSFASVERGFCSCSYRWHITWFVKIPIVCRLEKPHQWSWRWTLDWFHEEVKQWGFSVSYGDFLRGHGGFCESTLKEVSVEKRNQGAVLTIYPAAIFFGPSDSVYIFIFSSRGSSRVSSIRYPFLN